MCQNELLVQLWLVEKDSARGNLALDEGGNRRYQGCNDSQNSSWALLRVVDSVRIRSRNSTGHQLYRVLKRSIEFMPASGTPSVRLRTTSTTTQR